MHEEYSEARPPGDLILRYPNESSWGFLGFMRQKRKRKTKKSYRFHLLSFALGLVCSVPALSSADDLDEVIDDLIAHRTQVRVEKGANELNSGRVQIEPSRQTNTRRTKPGSATASSNRGKENKPAANNVAKATK